jgi:hypothetical protein
MQQLQVFRGIVNDKTLAEEVPLRRGSSRASRTECLWRGRAGSMRERAGRRAMQTCARNPLWFGRLLLLLLLPLSHFLPGSAGREPSGGRWGRAVAGGWDTERGPLWCAGAAAAASNRGSGYERGLLQMGRRAPPLQGVAAHRDERGDDAPQERVALTLRGDGAGAAVAFVGALSSGRVSVEVRFPARPPWFTGEPL